VTEAVDLVDMFRLGRLPEAWVAPPGLRQTRELVRYRAKLVALRSGLKAQVHSVSAKEGVSVPMTDLFGAVGNRLLNEVPFGPGLPDQGRGLPSASAAGLEKKQPTRPRAPGDPQT